jgi:hypothetical protein
MGRRERGRLVGLAAGGVADGRNLMDEAAGGVADGRNLMVRGRPSGRPRAWAEAEVER